MIKGKWPATLLIIWCLCWNTAVAQEYPSQNKPVNLQADELIYDRYQETITARGNVEISQPNRILRANEIVYNQSLDILSATGGVTLLEPTGEVIFAEDMKLSGDLRDGILEDLRIILSDNARIAANGARRSSGDVLEMRTAVYSPCNLCPEDPSRAPLWQLKAAKVVHDRSIKDIEYSDASLEIAGIPVFYTPYFSHPDPTVRRRSGFLAPRFGSSSDLGFVVKTPYFFDIEPNVDVTLTPIYTSEEGPVAAIEYRHLFTKGKLEVEGSLTRDSKNNVRSHVNGFGHYEIDQTWRTGLSLQGASSDTYMRRYRFGDASTLTSRIFAEGFRGRNHMSLNAYTFQGLQASDDQGETPIILPLFDYNHVGRIDRWGGHRKIDANFLILMRTGGTDSQRASVRASWSRPFVGEIGDLYTISASLHNDLYHVSKVHKNSKNEFSGFTGRVRPELNLEWRLPMMRAEKGRIHQFLEPIVAAIASPYGGNPDTIPNEDSQDFELNDTNLFSSNRFTGLDRVESGPRVNYGFRWGIFGDGGGSSSLLIGQSFRVRDDDTFVEGSGLEGNLSDIVTRFDVSPNESLKILYRARYDKETFEPNHQELEFRSSNGPLNISLGYLSIDGQTEGEFVGREEVRYSVSSALTPHWRAGLDGLQDLGASSSLRSLGLDLTYEDECLIFTTKVGRTFFEDRDLKPTDSIVMNLTFKTLGEAQISIR
jgi:LPS-assembly protein